MNLLETERPIPVYEDVKSHGVYSADGNRQSVLPMIFIAKRRLPSGELVQIYFKLDLDSSGEWVLDEKAQWNAPWSRSTAHEATAEYRFRDVWPLPDGELAPSRFELELDSCGRWTLYKRADGEENWFKVTAETVAAAGRRRHDRLSAMLVKGRRAND